MEYLNLWQPITLIFICFSMGIFFGALWMFYSMHNTYKQMEKELDSKTRLLTTYENSLNHPEDE